ncbi:LysR family transcriptional regulator [Tsuneonella sp. HG249]
MSSIPSRQVSTDKPLWQFYFRKHGEVIVALSRSERAQRVDAHGRALPSLPNLRGLEAFARTGSFAKAAIDQGLTLASISRRISMLERDLGVVLIERSSGEVAVYDLTEKGAKLASFLTPWLAALDEALPAEFADRPDSLRQGRGRPKGG